MVDALDASHNKAKGVAFVGEEVTDDELDMDGPRRGEGRALQFHQAVR